MFICCSELINVLLLSLCAAGGRAGGGHANSDPTGLHQRTQDCYLLRGGNQRFKQNYSLGLIVIKELEVRYKECLTRAA